MSHRLAVLVALLAVPAARADDWYTSPMFRDPDLPFPKPVKVYPPGVLQLWLKALDRPDADTRTQAALAVADAQRRGMPGLVAAAGPLAKELARPDNHPAARVAAAAALVAIDAKDAAPELLRAAQSGNAELREAVEPALARWDHRPARAVWLARLEKPTETRSLLLAVAALGAVKEPAAAGKLRELVLDPAAAPPVRLAAARSLAELLSSGGEADAEKLAADASPRAVPARLAAASLLRRHSGDAATKLLQSLAKDAEPAVAAAALERLAELGPDRVIAVLVAVLASPDAKVRGFGVDALSKVPSADHVRRLGTLLNDPHPDVRARTRLALRSLAGTPALRAAVIAAGDRALAGPDWRGQEQAAILFGQLKHTPAADRLVDKLASPKPEVFVAAAWGVRELAVPETLPAVLSHVQKRHREMKGKDPTAGLPGVMPADMDKHMSQLTQFLGFARYAPADPTLRVLVVRILGGGGGAGRLTPNLSPVGPEARAAAAWALGKLHEGDPEPRLVAQALDRLTGDGALGPDDWRVRRMAVVTLGRVKAAGVLDQFKGYAGGMTFTPDPVTNAAVWAVATITGRPVPPAGTLEQYELGWFLSPAR